MSAPTRTDESSTGEERHGTYVYGIVPSDVELVPETRGIGEPASEVTLVRHGDIAALVSDIDVGRPIGTPEDLTVHEQLLDATAAADVPVLPVRFGAVVTDESAVERDLLAEHHDVFATALRELEGRAEYIVHGRYVEEAVLEEVLSENTAAANMREQLRDMPEDASQNLRIQLGEIVNAAIDAKREADTGQVIEALAEHSVASAVRPPTHEQDAVHAAFLTELSKEKEFTDAVEALGREWEGRIKLRLRGPLAPYDFVVTLDPGTA